MTHLEINRLAQLSRLALNEEEIGALSDGVDAILSLTSALDGPDGRDTCMAQKGNLSHAEAVTIANALRADLPAKSLSRDKLLHLAPSADESFVTVPKILSDGFGEE